MPCHSLNLRIAKIVQATYCKLGGPLVRERRHNTAPCESYKYIHTCTCTLVLTSISGYRNSGNIYCLTWYPLLAAIASLPRPFHVHSPTHHVPPVQNDAQKAAQTCLASRPSWNLSLMTCLFPPRASLDSVQKGRYPHSSDTFGGGWPQRFFSQFLHIR